MRVTRRAFLRLAPASVGAIALGVMFWPKAVAAKDWTGHWNAIADTIMGLDHLEGEAVNVFPGGLSYVDVS